MTPSEQQQIRALNDVLESEIDIRLVENTHGTSAEQERSVAGQVVAPLMERFDQLEDQVKGDVLYVIGECGDANAGSFLRSVSAATQNNELREAAEDALEAMDLRM